jgi:uncharacterized integral membrane protein
MAKSASSVKFDRVASRLSVLLFFFVALILVPLLVLDNVHAVTYSACNRLTSPSPGGAAC